ncbi:MAG: hypothetical protein ACOVJ5_00100 [Gloeomargaritales cyanobacterium]
MPVKFKSEVSLDALNNATTDTDKFLVSDSGIVKYRTGTQLLSDLGVSGLYVPYTGATGNVDLGTHTLSSYNLIVNHTSGSGVAASITKGGSGEALTINKSSGSGNAMSVTGGLTSLVDLTLSSIPNATIDTDRFIVSDGGAIKYRTGAQVLSDIGGQAALTNPITGTGTTNYVSKFTGATTLGNSQIFDNGTNVGIGTTTPGAKLHVVGEGIFDDNTYGRLTLGFAASQNDIYSTTTGFGSWKNFRISSNELILSTGGTNERMRITSSGNVGIGTTSPVSLLHVEGSAPVLTMNRTLGAFTNTINFNAGSNYASIISNSQSGEQRYSIGPAAGWGGFHTFYTDTTERMRIASNGAIKFNSYGSGSFTGTATQRLAVDSSGNVIEIPIGGGAVDGSGTTNYVTKWVDADTIGNSVMYDNGTNVGIGTTSPNFLIHSNGSGANSYMQFTSATTGTTSSDGLIIGTGDVGDAVFLNRENTTMQFYTNNTERMRIASSGNVGINTTAPIHKLSVNGKIGGDVYADSFVEFTATTETIVSADGNVVLGYAQNVVVDNEGSLGVGTIAPEVCAAVEIKSTTQGFLPPRMDTRDRDNIDTPVFGLMIFNTDDEVVQVFTNGGGWRTLAWL